MPTPRASTTSGPRAGVAKRLDATTVVEATPIREATRTNEPERSGEEAPLDVSSRVKNTPENWCCKSCNTTEESLRYKSGLMANCYICQAYANAVINSREKKKKRAGKGHNVVFTLEEFHAWARANPRICRYCRVTDAEYYAMGFQSANGKTLEALGLDRRVDGDYSLDNIDWCCYICNRTKNTVFTTAEMEEIGAVISNVWSRRRAEAALEAAGQLFDTPRTRRKPTVVSIMPGEVPPTQRKTKARRPARGTMPRGRRPAAKSRASG